MTVEERKRERAEGIAEKFLLLPEADKRYIAGFLAGKEDERQHWEKKLREYVTGAV